MYRPNGKASKAHAVILSRKNIGEADRIITVFTKEHGKMRLLAKGVRKSASRRAPHLEIFSSVALVIHQGKSMDTITEVTPLSPSSRIVHDLEHISVAYFYCELVNLLLPEKQEHRNVYVSLVEALEALGRSDGEQLHVQTKTFALSLLRELGFLDTHKQLSGKELQSFIENITERRLRTPKLIRQIFANT